jgi:hypothetical protein
MTLRRLTTLAVLLTALAGATPALAAGGVQPSPNRLLTGTIRFHRAQAMTVQTSMGSGTTLTVALGFDGTCKGGGLGEVWAAYIPVGSTVTVRKGSFSASLTGTSENFGGVTGRTATFHWRFKGSFTDPTTIAATVSGRADVRAGGKVISRCRIATPASVRLTEGG